MKIYEVTFLSGKTVMLFACGFKHAHEVARRFFPDDVGKVFYFVGVMF